MKFYGQDGADIWLFDNGYVNRSDKQLTYVDVGASDAFQNSNTAFLDQLGYRGLCIDADARVEQSYRNRNCIFELAICTDKPRVVEYYLSPLQEASGLSDTLGDATMVHADATTLSELLDKHDFGSIDVLSIDVEGHEVEVLTGLNWSRYKPRIVIAEYSTFGKQNSEIIDYMKKKRYKLVHSTQYNHIFVR